MRTGPVRAPQGPRRRGGPGGDEEDRGRRNELAMKSSPGRRAAVASAVLAVAVAVLAAVVFRQELLIPYYLWRLDSSELSTRLEAAESLGKLRSTRAAPRLLELLRADPRQRIYEAALEEIG